MTHTKTKKEPKTGKEVATISTVSKSAKTFKCESKNCNGITFPGKGIFCNDCKGLKRLQSYEDHVEFLPMVRTEKRENSYIGHSLAKGKYDINYIINLLKIIMTKCEEMKHNPRDLQFTLWTSTQKLLAMLEVERDQP